MRLILLSLTAYSKGAPVTPEYRFYQRRMFLKYGALAGAILSFPEWLKAQQGATLQVTKESLATSYNNFYEFSLDKEEVKSKVENWKLDPNWEVHVSGLVEKPKSYKVPELIKLGGGTEERIYRFRCVEAWSMVVPWQGFSLGKLIENLNPSNKAKYIKFETFSDKKIGPNIAMLPNYPWPYTEGLTIEEAKHPLTILATGMYGKPLPKQNGAPIRLIVPWKYGFKSIKSIVKIEFTETQPKTLWNQLAPNEYGFYANVNPNVSHPRWSQATERILDNSLFPKRQPTLMFNGYDKEVAHLYKNLDLKKFY